MWPMSFVPVLTYTSEILYMITSSVGVFIENIADVIGLGLFCEWKWSLKDFNMETTIRKTLKTGVYVHGISHLTHNEISKWC